MLHPLRRFSHRLLSTTPPARRLPDLRRVQSDPGVYDASADRRYPGAAPHSDAARCAQLLDAAAAVRRQLEALRGARNAAAKAAARAVAAGGSAGSGGGVGDAEAQRRARDEVAALQGELDALTSEAHALALALPNEIHPLTPDGDDSAAIVVESVGARWDEAAAGFASVGTGPVGRGPCVSFIYIKI
jgi:seryl-tRNA synthetase